MPGDRDVTRAWLRDGAGPMRDRRAPRGGARNESRDLIAEEAGERLMDGVDGRGRVVPEPAASSVRRLLGR